MRIKTWIILLTIVVAGVSFSKYRTMQGMEDDLREQWATLEQQYHYRINMVPELVRTVKIHTDTVPEVITKLTSVRAKVANFEFDPDNFTADHLTDYQRGQNSLYAALNGLTDFAQKRTAISEDQKYLEQMAKLKGIENRIGIERRRFNEKVKKYNRYLKQIPNNLLASALGYEQLATLETE